MRSIRLPLTSRVSAVLASSCALPLAVFAAPEISIEQPAGTSLAMNRVVGWGWNDQGQTTVPANLTGVIAIDAGGYGSAALKIDGTAVLWGANATTLIPAGGFSNVAAISHGGGNLVALKTDGSIIAAGYAHNPVPISPNLGSLGVASGGGGWSVAIKSDTTAVVWGENTPTVPVGLTGLAAVSAGDFHVVGLKTDGTVVAWGNNSNGQGVIPAALSGVACTAVAAGKRHSLVLKSDGTTYAWGFNDNGGGLAVTPPSLTGVVAIAAGGHALALKNDDTIVGWGRNAEGQLNTPAGLTKIRAISAGDYHSLALAGSVIAFAPQILGTVSATRTFTIKNTGADPLTISGVSLFGPDAAQFTLNTAGMLTTLPALTGQTTVTVAFNPSSAGAKKTFLRVLNNDGDEATFEILLTGTGVLSEVAVAGNGVSIADGDSTPSSADHTDFGGLPFAGTSGVTRTFTVSNGGTGTLTLGSVTLGGANASDFTVVAQPAASLAPGASTTFQIAFDPSAVGLRAATLSFANNDPDENPFNFSIQGTGQEPEIAVREAGVDIPDGSTPASSFGDVLVSDGIHGRTFTVHNTGTSALTLGAPSITGANASDFYVNYPPSATVAPGASSNFQIIFDPTAPGLRTATLSLANNDADENPFNFELRGTGLAPAITVRGNGVDIITGDSTPVAADHTDFGSAHTPSGSRSRTYTILNPGVGTLVLGSVTVGGAQSGDFVVTAPPPASVANGASATFSVEFSPSAAGLRSATLTFTTNVTGLPSFTFAIQGTGIAPEISVENPEGVPLVVGAVTAWGANDLGQLNVPAGLQGVVSLVSGWGHITALRADGTVVSWGQNDYGQASVPTGLKHVVKIAAGRWHNVALKADGTLAAWGFNSRGQASAVGITDVADIAAGQEFTIIRRTDGTIAGWGSNYFGETSLDTSLTDVVAIAAGYGHTMALRANGVVRVWGRASEGQGQAGIPADIGTVTDIASGFNFCLARRADGTLRAWGENSHNQVGLAYAQTGIASIANGVRNGLGLKTDGSLAIWGDNGGGQTNIPAGLSGIRAYTAGLAHAAVARDAAYSFGARVNGRSGTPRTFTIKSTGATPLTVSGIVVTGANASDFTVNASSALGSLSAVSGQTTFTVTFTPSGIGPRTARLRVQNDDADEGAFDIALSGVGVPASEIAVSGNAVDIVSGDAEPALADHTDFGGVTPVRGSVTCTFTIANTGTDPLALGAITLSGSHAADFTVTAPPVSPVAPGGSTTFAVTFDPSAPGLRSATVSIVTDDEDENPFTFAVQGQGIAPEIVVANSTGAELPATAVVAWGSNSAGQLQIPAPLSGVIAVSAGGEHSLALRADGTVSGWGSNALGQLDIPVGLSGATAIAAGARHSLALRADGTVVGWGYNDYGQTTAPAGLGDVTAISAGVFHSMALKRDGTVVVWGDGGYGQQSIPSGLSGVTAISAGAYHNLALCADGTVSGWGDYAYGQALPPFGLDNVVGIAAGAFHSLALKQDGTVIGWGYNGSGQIDIPAGLSDVVAIGAGIEYSVALKRNGTVVAWGTSAAVPGLPAPALSLAAGHGHTLALTGTSVDFGSLLVHASGTPRTFIIKNTGVDPLVIDGVEVVGPDAADFQISPVGLQTTLPALTGQTSVTVTFAPSTPGPRRAWLRVRSNDGDEEMSVFALSGVATEPVLTPLETWRVTHFGAPDNTGTAADAADHDGDGVANLLEYAFGLDPTDAASAQLPVFDASGAALTYDFTAPTSVSDIHYGAEWSTTLAPGSWTAVPDTGAAPRHIFSVPLNGRPRLFLRLVITPQP